MILQYKHSDKFIFEPESYRLVLKERVIKLSHKESAVLKHLCDSSMRVVERRYLLTEIWSDSESSGISLNKTILQLRRKFESIGIHDAIDTVPRVGYMLKISMENREECLITKKHGHLVCDSDCNLPQINSSINPSIFPLGNIKKPPYLIIISLITIILIYLIIKFELLEKESNHPIKNTDIFISRAKDKNLYYTSEISSNDLDKYLKITNGISSDNEFYALASKNVFSFINIESAQENNSPKIFFFDKNIDIETQVDCIIKNVHYHKPPTIEFTKLPGMAISRLDFYRPCNVEESYQGSLVIKSTVKKNDSSTWTQDFRYFNKENGEQLFHLKRFSRTTPGRTARKLKIKSFHVYDMNQEALQSNAYIHKIFNQITQDEIILKTIDENNRIYASSVFGGIFFHVNQY
ncbi:helix-turn-helix domain-containing protein (plasmid) [Vibrio alginolyticus]|uniref:winged helix-turn-helix domain-containing protein n=1 Tax=Vibrio alginolyticus TaxID=663 RepID=UPI0015934A8E|nr:helix-turn-helix domain-containing protein [Vibrio alginolyticus]QKS98631.1 helix-turn-helix domain-containing protein [Vibrio alginolyticus]